tara:strand:+ start:420 stop:860 length:441 start_codon:yes stop_codon:yes gene_type:complete
MENEKKTIKESLNEIRKVMEQESDNVSLNKVDSAEEVESNADILLLDKIILGPKNEKIKTELDEKKISNLQNLGKNKKNIKKVEKPKVIIKKIKKKNEDPIALVVEREIKPIIKKWINKNLRSFVKSIVIEEMKQISEATLKRTIK